jgi:hypothetical protein
VSTVSRVLLVSQVRFVYLWVVNHQAFRLRMLEIELTYQAMMNISMSIDTFARAALHFLQLKQHLDMLFDRSQVSFLEL